MLDGDVDATHKSLADHRAHRTAHETEFEGRGDHRQGADRALHHHQGIALAGRLDRLFQALRILAAVLEFQAVQRTDVGTDLKPALRVKQAIESFAGADAMVVTTLRAHLRIVAQVDSVQRGVACRAFNPNAFRHALFRPAIGAIDFWRQQLVDPTHVSSFVFMEQLRLRCADNRQDKAR